MATTRTQLGERAVVSTATLLDATVPGWADLIDTNRLNLWSSVSCIFGQLADDPEVKAKLPGHAARDWNSLLMYTLQGEDGDTYYLGQAAVVGDQYSPQHRTWLREIERRRSEPCLVLDRILGKAQPKPEFTPTREEIEAARAQVIASLTRDRELVSA